MQYTVSVITPFHNTDKRVFKRSFNSVLSQTIGFENIEYVIVVHNSKKEYLDFVTDLAKGHDNIKVLPLDNDNHTPSSPRNYGLRNAAGKYIAFMDSDDIFYPEALSEASKTMEEEKAQICLFRFDNAFADSGNVVSVRQYSMFDQTSDKIVLEKGKYDQKKLVSGITMTVHTKLYDGDFIRQNNLYFDEAISFAEGGYYNIEAFSIAEKIVIMPKLIGYQYLQSSGSAMQTFKRSRDDLWEIGNCIAKTAEKGFSYGLYIDSYLTEIAASTGAFVLCSDVDYKFIKKLGNLVRPYLKLLKPLEETKIDRKENIKTFNLVNKVVYFHPLLTAFITGALHLFRIDLEKIIKGNFKI